MWAAFWAGDGPVPIINEAPNSVWGGLSGSVGGADFIEPDEWATGFWPPDEAVALPVALEIDLACSFAGISARGYLTATLDLSDHVGEVINFSIFVDEVISPLNPNCIHITSDASLVRAVGSLTVGFVGRRDSEYLVTGAGNVNLRIGLGTTSNNTGEFTLSRPQVTVGSAVRPYTQTF